MTTLRTGFAAMPVDLERIAIVGIRTVGVVSGAYADVLDEHVGSGDPEGGTADHDAG